LARRVITVSQLGQLAGLDSDETLLQLWDAGLDRYKDPSDRVHRQDLDGARHAVGLPSTSDLITPAYWMRRLNLTEEELDRLLFEFRVPRSKNSRKLPKGAVSKLKLHARKRIDTSPQVVSQKEREARRPPDVEESFAWRTVGNVRPLRLLSQDEVAAIHEELVVDFALDADPIDPPGVRSEDLLGSAVFRQHTSLGEVTKYPTVEMAAAALMHGLVHDHPFHNGNKRTALVAMLVLLDENGVKPTCGEDELFQLVLRLAQHRLVRRGKDLSDRETISLAEWIHARSRVLEKGERPIQWRKLRQILADFDCEISHASSNRLRIRRTVPERGMFGRTRARTLTTQVKYADDGRQALVDTVKKIRRDLWLDEAHGYDSIDFYQHGGVSPSLFIMEYRKTLKRLARL
jgi:death-on-curing family protein